MDDILRAAMVAARAGQKKEAQFLLTQLLQANPQDANAWFLLSHLVDSEQKQIAYLEKVVALDPGHQKAAEQLAELTGMVSEPAVAEPMAVQPAAVEPETVMTAAPELAIEPSAVDSIPDDPDQAMDWLEQLAETSAAKEDTDFPASAETSIAKIPAPAIESEPETAETAVSTATLIPPPRPEPAANDASKQLQRLNITLAILVVLMIIVLYFLITVLF